MRILADLFGSAKQIIQNEGLTAFVRRAFSFIWNHLLFYETYYLFEHTLKDRNETEYMPRLHDFSLKVISANREVGELAANGFDLRPWYPAYRKRLDKGAIAFCVFVGPELAHIGWVAMTPQAKDSLNEPAYNVDFSNGEACAGAAWTNPKYRRLGLRQYSLFKRLQFLRDNGLVRGRGATTKRNIAMKKATDKFGSKIYAEARYLKILWWKSWKEKPLTPG